MGFPLLAQGDCRCHGDCERSKGGSDVISSSQLLAIQSACHTNPVLLMAAVTPSLSFLSMGLAADDRFRTFHLNPTKYIAFYQVN